MTDGRETVGADPVGRGFGGFRARTCRKEDSGVHRVSPGPVKTIETTCPAMFRPRLVHNRFWSLRRSTEPCSLRYIYIIIYMIIYIYEKYIKKYRYWNQDLGSLPSPVVRHRLDEPPLVRAIQFPSRPLQEANGATEGDPTAPVRVPRTDRRNLACGLIKREASKGPESKGLPHSRGDSGQLCGHGPTMTNRI